MRGKYKIYTNGTSIYAVSRYAGKPVRASATCHPDDSFDAAYGVQLAALRCNLKIAKKRVKNAKRLYIEAYNEFLAAKNKVAKYAEFLDDATDQVSEARNELEDHLNGVH